MAYVAASDVVLYGDWASSDDDALLSVLITRATAIIEEHTGRCFEAASNTRYFDAVEDVHGRTLYLDADLAVIASDTTITNGDGQTVAASDYVTEPRNDGPFHAITIRNSSSASWTYTLDPENAITIDGKWGYSVAAPDDIKHATIRIVKWLYDQRKTDEDMNRPLLLEGGHMVMPGRLPHDVMQILEKYRRGSYFAI